MIRHLRNETVVHCHGHKRAGTAKKRRAFRTSHVLRTERLERRLPLDASGEAISSPWQNQADPLDVNSDNAITPLDALVIINELNTSGARPLAGAAVKTAGSGAESLPIGQSLAGFVDVNGDQLLTPSDALAVINSLNTKQIPLVQVRLAAADTNGDPLTQIDVGQDFQLLGFVEDLRAAPRGVFAAYLDVTFNPAFVSVNGPISFGDEYGNGQSGDASVAGTIDEVGAFDGFDDLGGGEFLLFSVPMTATANGSVTFAGDPADELPDHDTLLFGQGTAVPVADITFVSANLQVGSSQGLPEISVSDAQLVEGDSGTSAMEFTVSLSEASETEITVDYATSAMSALEGLDFNASNGTLTFAAGETDQTLTVEVVGDVLNEDDETFAVNLSNPTNAVLADSQGVGTIIDDDDAPLISISDVQINEGDSGNVQAAFTVTLSEESGMSVSVDFATSAGTATANEDYVPNSGTVTFEPGVTSQMVLVDVIGDTLEEDDETFFVDLTNPVNASIDDSQGEGLILDDDGAAAVMRIRLEVIDDQGNVVTTVNVGEDFILRAFVEDLRIDPAGVFAAYLDVTYDESLVTVGGDIMHGPEYGNGPSGDTTMAGVIDEVGSFDGTEELGGGEFLLYILEFTASAAGTLDFVGNPADVSPDHDSLLFNRSTPVNPAEIDFVPATLVIAGAGGPQLSIDDIQITEGDNGVQTGTLTVSLSSASDATVSVNYSTSEDTATADVDFESTGGTITFEPGVTTATIDVGVIGDTEIEGDETFFVNLSDPTGAEISDGQGVVTIIDDDAPTGPTLSIGDPQLPEGDAGTTEFVFTVTLSEPSDEAVTVDFNTVDGTALAGEDYEEASGTLTFEPGTTSQTITVLVNGDTDPEEDETFEVVLSSPQNATISQGSAPGVIIDDDQPILPTLSIADPQLPEGNSGITDFEFTVTLSEASDQVVTVDFATVAGTATANVDYNEANGTLTFEPGETTQTIVVEVIGDFEFEGDEIFDVVLSSPQNAAISQGSAMGIILNDDQEGGNATLSGLVYADVNNDGTKDETEDGIENVTVRLFRNDGGNPMLVQETSTAADGSYQFSNLAAGNYSIVEVHPAFFVDGIDANLEAPGTAQNDQFVNIEVQGSEDLVAYNFGERGLRAEFVTKGLFLSSTPSGRGLDARVMADGLIWHAFDEGFAGVLTAEATALTGDVALALFDVNMNLIASTPLSESPVLQFDGQLGSPYFLRVSGPGRGKVLDLDFDGQGSSIAEAAFATNSQLADEALSDADSWLA